MYLAAFLRVHVSQKRSQGKEFPWYDLLTECTASAHPSVPVSSPAFCFPVPAEAAAMLLLQMATTNFCSRWPPQRPPAEPCEGEEGEVLPWEGWAASGGSCPAGTLQALGLSVPGIGSGKILLLFPPGWIWCFQMSQTESQDTGSKGGGACAPLSARPTDSSRSRVQQHSEARTPRSSLTRGCPRAARWGSRAVCQPQAGLGQHRTNSAIHLGPAT